MIDNFKIGTDMNVFRDIISEITNDILENYNTDIEGFEFRVNHSVTSKGLVTKKFTIEILDKDEKIMFSFDMIAIRLLIGIFISDYQMQLLETYIRSSVTYIVINYEG